MINNLPVKTLAHKDLTIEGYSRAAVQTYWRIPELKLGFDLGAQPWSFMGTPTWFVSHTHMDHLIALPVYVARRRMMKMEPPAIYLPEAAVEPMQRMLRLFSRMDRGRLPCTLLPMQAGRRDRAVARAGGHRFGHDPHGAVAGFRGVGAAAEAQARVPRPARRADPRSAARRHGSDHRGAPAAAWPTWATARRQGLDACPAMFEAEVLIMELTFVSPKHRKDKIHKFGHMHLDDLMERRERFRNELVIASHFSTRYHPNQIRDCVDQGPARHARRPAAFVDVRGQGLGAEGLRD